VLPPAAFELRKIGLADGLLLLLLDSGHQFALSHFAFKAAEAPFDHAEVADFFTGRHIALRNQNIANCYIWQEKSNLIVRNLLI
jgi:hypothetical protein